MKNQKISKWIASLLAAAMLAGCLCVPALAAADVPSLNPDESGSVSVTLGGVKDGELTLYEVAELGLDNRNMAYTKTDAFSGFDGDLDVNDSSLAGRLAGYVSENQVSGTAQDISSGGEVSFLDLTLGLYLIVQTEPSAGFYPIDPFLVTVPIAENDQWVYDVDAGPKVEVTPQPEGTPEPSETPEPTETPGTSESPNPSGSPTPSVTTTAGGGTPGATGGGGGTTSTGTGSHLPQTGQLHWPVFLLSGLGIAFIAAGIVLVHTGRKLNYRRLLT